MRVLKILGFSQQRIVSREQVRAAFLDLPDSHTRGIGLIRYDPNRLVHSAINQYLEPVPGSVRGSFYHSETMQAVILWRFDSAVEFYHILYHEVGHYVFMKTLSQQQRDAWLYDIRKKEKVTVSSYACANAKEDFSECYASWFTQPDVLRRCPMRCQFLATALEWV